MTATSKTTSRTAKATAGRSLADIVLQHVEEIVTEHGEELAAFSRLGTLFEHWLLWEWGQKCWRDRSWRVTLEPFYRSHGLLDPQTTARGDLLIEGEDQRLWVELSIIGENLNSHSLGARGPIALDRERLVNNRGRGFDMLHAVVTVSRHKPIADSSSWGVIATSPWWSEKANWVRHHELPLNGEAMVAGWVFPNS